MINELPNKIEQSSTIYLKYIILPVLTTLFFFSNFIIRTLVLLFLFLLFMINENDALPQSDSSMITAIHNFNVLAASRE